MEQKIQVYTEDYTKYVVQKLKRIKGKSESDVVNFIIKDWIGDHLEELKEYGISVNNAKKEGYSAQEIKESLIDAGWPDDLVEKEFKTHIEKKQKAPDKKHKK